MGYESMSVPDRKLGWIGTGRMGYALARRLLERGCDLSVYNRTRAKAEPLAAMGARLVDRPSDLADREMVVVSVSDSPDFASVMTGPQGLLSNGGAVPRVVVDTSTVSMDVSQEIRGRASRAGSALLAAPVSGNAKVARAGKLTMAVSGPRDAFDFAEPYLQMLGSSVVYVGEGEAARLVKICHNLVLGVVTQILAETTVLAERGGVGRAEYLGFLNGSVMGSTFSRYKTPALVNLDFTPTFTGHLLRKDFELGLDEARRLNVPMPVSSLVHELVMSLVGQGMGDLDFASLLKLEAMGANLELVPDPRNIADGLSDEQSDGTGGQKGRPS
jgi:3-hydroxyisobutyrate dehydrogenase